MATLVEYGTRCFYENTNFYCADRSVSILIKTENFSFSEILRRELICVSGLYRTTWKYFQLQQNCLYDIG